MTKQIRDVIRLKNGKILRIAALDACKLLVDVTSVAYIEERRNKDSDIISISFEGDETISVGDEVAIRVGLIHTVYKVKTIIFNKGRTNVILFSSLPTKTSTFLLPLLNKTKFQLRYDSYFVNAYISDCHKYICLLYRYTGTETYKTFEKTMLADKLCVTHIDYDRYHVMYVFRIPDQFIPDVQNFLKGKYSLFSPELKRLIIKFYGGTKESVIFQIIYKSPALKATIEKDLGVELDKDAELASIPVVENEIYNLTKDYE